MKASIQDAAAHPANEMLLCLYQRSEIQKAAESIALATSYTFQRGLAKLVNTYNMLQELDLSNSLAVMSPKGYAVPEILCHLACKPADWPVCCPPSRACCCDLASIANGHNSFVEAPVSRTKAPAPLLDSSSPQDSKGAPCHACPACLAASVQKLFMRTVMYKESVCRQQQTLLWHAYNL